MHTETTPSAPPKGAPVVCTYAGREFAAQVLEVSSSDPNEVWVYNVTYGYQRVPLPQVRVLSDMTAAELGAIIDRRVQA